MIYIYYLYERRYIETLNVRILLLLYYVCIIYYYCYYIIISWYKPKDRPSARVLQYKAVGDVCVCVGGGLKKEKEKKDFSREQ